jgi:uncharacterized membrane protein
VRAQDGATGALFGLGAGALVVPRLGSSGMLVAVSLCALCGAAAGLRFRQWPALQHPGAALLCALAGLAMFRFPEPAFFLLVPLVAAQVAWPVDKAPSVDDRIPRGAVPASFFVAACVFFLQSANRHWQFASGSKDLGLFVQQHWLIAHGYVPFNTIMGMHMLADHMTFIDFLIAPLLLLRGGGAETLLLVQAVGVASAAFPLFGLGRRYLGDRAGLALAWTWLLSPEVHMGVLFDYNQSPLGSALLLWTAWALALRGVVAVLLTALLACACKTNFPLYVAVLGLVLPLLRLSTWRRGAAVAALALSLFGLEIAVLSPMFREGGFRHWEFEDLGETPAEITISALARPDKALALLVDEPEKRRSLLLPLLTTGYVGLADPVSLALLLPNWGERFLSTHRTRWWGYYYGMPAAAMATLGLLAGWRQLKATGIASRRLPVYVLACALLAGLFPPYRTPSGNSRSDLYHLRQPNASPEIDVRTQRDLVRFISHDPRLRVAAQYNLLPHLAERPFIVMLDRALDAEVIALQLDGGTYPEGRPAWKRRLSDLGASGAFSVAFCEGQSVVLRRRPGPEVPCPAWDALMRARPRPRS